MFKYFVKYSILIILVIFVSGISLAQDTAPASVFVCVAPADNAQTPYTMAFQRTTAFGLLIPKNANVAIYSNEKFTSALYTINTDAGSGGYRTLERLATLNSGIILPTNLDCGEQFREELDGANYYTLPIPVSVNHALLIELDGLEETNLTNEPTVRGVLAFTFRPDNSQDATAWFNFQILQISEIDPVIEFAAPFILLNTPFSVIANKTFSIGQSQSGVIPPQFPPNLQPSNPRQFVQADLQNIFSLNIFNIMESGSIRIYPESGVYGVYSGAYFRISVSSEIPEREFTEKSIIRALEGAEATTVLLNRFDENPWRVDIPFDTENTSRLQGDSTTEVVRLEEGSGQLIVLEGTEEAIIQSWLVEPVE